MAQVVLVLLAAARMGFRAVLLGLALCTLQEVEEGKEELPQERRTQEEVAIQFRGRVLVSLRSCTAQVVVVKQAAQQTVLKATKVFVAVAAVVMAVVG